MLAATLLGDHINCITLKKNDEPFKLIKTFGKSLPFCQTKILPFLCGYDIFIILKVPKHLFCHKVWPRRLCEVNDSDYNIKQNTECLIDGFVMIMRTLVGGGLMLILSPTPSRNNLENANTTELWRSDLVLKLSNCEN